MQPLSYGKGEKSTFGQMQLQVLSTILQQKKEMQNKELFIAGQAERHLYQMGVAIISFNPQFSLKYSFICTVKTPQTPEKYILSATHTFKDVLFFTPPGTPPVRSSC